MILNYLRWSNSRDAVAGPVWTKIGWVAFWACNLALVTAVLILTHSTTRRLIDLAVAPISVWVLAVAVRNLRARLANRQYAGLTRDVKTALRAMPLGHTISEPAHMAFVHQTFRLTWWWPVTVDTLLRTPIADLADAYSPDGGTVLWESFSARRDGSPIMRTVDGMRVRCDEDGNAVGDWRPAGQSAADTMRALSSGLHDVTAEELAELAAQIAAARPVPEDEGGTS